jgi:uncharacterized membrane protein YoaK (UPF0700 family)
MTRFDRRIRLLAACLSALAGYVDALAFLKLGGFFVSFMSGNTTRLGVGLAQWSVNAVIAGGLIATFVAGVFVGSLAGGAAGAHRRPAVLVLVSLLLAVAAALYLAGHDMSAIAAMALAMGAENAVFEENGDVRIGLTYMTGTLVKVGQRLAAAATGGDRLAWAPYLLLWAGLVLGATAGAATYPRLGLGGLWIAAVAAAVLAASSGLIRERKGAADASQRGT